MMNRIVDVPAMIWLVLVGLTVLAVGIIEGQWLGTYSSLVIVVIAAAKARLVENTEKSVARGTFGAPMFYVGDEPFFGKDSLRDVEDMIAGR